VGWGLEKHFILNVVWNTVLRFLSYSFLYTTARSVRSRHGLLAALLCLARYVWTQDKGSTTATAVLGVCDSSYN